jgi:ribonucleoside-diphosphate reductase alpha chain
LNDYETFIYKSRYARWIDKENRRENWNETVNRYISFMADHVRDRYGDNVNDELDWNALYLAIHELEVMPSMRALMTAGEALERCNVAGYNCAYLPVDSPRSFDECMYILMCGTGVGFSVERQYVSGLPVVNEHFEDTDTVIKVGDSKSGWAKALRELVSLLYSGRIPSYDLSGLRPAGARLLTFGGRSSGPEPLDRLFKFVIDTFKKAAGRKLTSLECHDIMCMIGEVVVVGGVRRSALISLSNVSDDRMRNAKSGDWRNTEPQRALANNSACYTERPDLAVFFDEWTSLYKSHSGERGIFNRQASKLQAGRNGRRDTDQEFGTNPCCEIILRPFQFCNLSSVIVRADDTLETLKKKVKLATILGTLQSTLTDFKYLRKIWRDNCEEERLLGVSLNGILDRTRWTPEELDTLRQVAIDTNFELSLILGINQSVAITCVKPEGNSSQMVGAASGIHPRWSEYYIRGVQADVRDPMTQFLKEQGVPCEPYGMSPRDINVFSFPQKSPDGATTRMDITATEHLEIWKMFQDHWCEHKPSITVQVKDDEWFAVGAWVWRHFDSISGIAFMPFSGGEYKQAPYQACTKEEYEELIQKMPSSIEWERLSEYEFEDHTTASQEFACVGGTCDIVDIGR